VKGAFVALSVSSSQPIEQDLLGGVSKVNPERGTKFMGACAKLLSLTSYPAAEIQDDVDPENERSRGDLPEQRLQSFVPRVVLLVIAPIAKIITEQPDVPFVRREAQS
jgi:hypothetical protein